MKTPFFPSQASDVARQTDYLFYGLTAFSLLMLLVLAGSITFCIFKYRRGKPANRRPLNLPELKIELAWTLVPSLFMLGFFIWGAERYFNIQRVPPNAMEINIVGKQWMWKIRHPSGRGEINELHVPAGRVVKLMMTSQDVIHSFFLPDFRIKQDVVPGRYTTEWLKAEKPGRHRLLCSEYCGTDHSLMNGWLVVMEPDEYEEWLAQGPPGEGTMAQSGEALYRELGCSGCHSGSAIIVAPPLEGLFGKPVPLTGGGMVTADETYIRDSILLPNKQIAAGYSPEMPSFQGRVTEGEIMELIAYIKSLAGASPPHTSPGDRP